MCVVDKIIQRRVRGSAGLGGGLRLQMGWSPRASTEKVKLEQRLEVSEGAL